MTDIEKTAHVLGKLAKFYEKVMYKNSGHHQDEFQARRYVELRETQKRQIRKLQEDTPNVRS